MISRFTKYFDSLWNKPIIAKTSEIVFRGWVERLEDRMVLSASLGQPQFEIGIDFFPAENILPRTPSFTSAGNATELSETRIPLPFLIASPTNSFFENKVISANHDLPTIFLMPPPAGFLDNVFQNGFPSINYPSGSSVISTSPQNFDPSHLQYQPADLQYPPVDLAISLPLARLVMTPIDSFVFDLTESMLLKSQSFPAPSEGDIFLVGLAAPPARGFVPPPFNVGFANSNKDFFPPAIPARLFHSSSFAPFPLVHTAPVNNETDFLARAPQAIIEFQSIPSSSFHIQFSNTANYSPSSADAELASLSTRKQTPYGVTDNRNHPSEITNGSSVNSRLKREFDAVDEVMASLDDFQNQPIQPPSGRTEIFAPPLVNNENPLERPHESFEHDIKRFDQRGGMVLIQATGDPNGNDYDLLARGKPSPEEYLVSNIAPLPKMEAYYAFDVGGGDGERDQVAISRHSQEHVQTARQGTMRQGTGRQDTIQPQSEFPILQQVEQMESKRDFAFYESLTFTILVIASRRHLTSNKNILAKTH